MKKLYILFLFLISITLISCKGEFIPSLLNQKKESKFYYTSELSKFVNSNDFKIGLFDTNLNKDLEVPKESNAVLLKFLGSLKSQNFLTPTPESSKVTYKLFILSGDNKKFVINIHDRKNISIHPWDGVYTMDYIDMENIPLAYNLYDFCEVLLKK